MAEIQFTKGPEREEFFQAGDRAEVYCDHKREGERVRDWLQGLVVQADPKMVAIQFQEIVYLTGGWMIPDHVLWCPHKSSDIRYYRSRRRGRRPSKRRN